ncbi:MULTISPECIES: NAD(P)/FAD-dependent oxidoreductase [unclassified Lysobacter]|uniref:NAD(P)/FAD-dependent oxidoreductase n=1 Tax=unclassified Lysobacter TaxID=2635362 RepID=UPI0006F313AB|nr:MULTISPECIES: NAD(P)/FAD-dependent oxidoreductase [unclassified Lysobacter]KQZ56976.1 pyridine nucleotide-disulfide oxidoreductase [Lysobacter sp. Root559]KRA81910.1 pyridine nucleotide-disulfide oxidoreductase [Lysobacter sp. Root667]KRC34818.1 pyridine nucleotide-disulfide oxidoreductase [Lysobacter sp. Root76]KRD70507.1 pyridine nucleotide-disulfide oxidoreductase [Lysobacter sp. Root96]
MNHEPPGRGDARVPHVVIVGGGFGGLWTTRALASADVRITLIDRRNHHLFQPLLYQVATAGLSSPDIAAPLRHILRSQRNVEVRLGEVVGLDPAARRVALADGDSIGYDYLLLASGAAHAYFGHDDWAGDAPGLKTLDDALHIRRRLLLAFERAEASDDEAERAAWLSFAVVGGGPTGVELAGTLAEIARKTLRREFRRIDPAQAKVRLIEAGPRVLSSFPEELSEKARKQLQKLGVEVVTGTPVNAIDERGYTLGDTFVPARTVVWAAGVAASKLGALLDAPRDRAGRVQVLPDLSVPGHPEIFVAGDLASVQQDGKPVPGVAPAAKQMGAHVARAIRDRIAGRSTAPFRYKDYGNLATIGRMAAVVDVHGFKLSGLLAWWFWLAAHVFFLIGFRNRVIVLINWAWAYWSYQRHARIILGDREE